MVGSVVISSIVLAAGLLVIGAVLSVLLPKNGFRATASIGTQVAACALTGPSILHVLRTRSAIEGTLHWSYPIEVVTLRVDTLSAFFLAWSLPMTLLGTIYAVGYLQPYFASGRNGAPQFALLNMTSLAFLVVYSAQNALVFLLGWEIAAVAAWLLVIWDYRNQKVRFAGFNYLISTHLGLFVLVAAFMLMYAQTGSMDFAAFGEVLSKPGRVRGMAFLLLGVSFALKSAFFPFHTWLPRAHSAAPAHVSALMSGVIHKAGLFAFLRFLLLTGRPEEWMGWTVLLFGAASAFFGVLYTSAQRDLKRLLGYSSTENVGIAAIGFGVGCLGMTWGIPSLVAAGFTGGLLHLLNHGIFKCLLFYAAGGVYRATHTVDLERLGGLLRRLPSTGWLFLTGGIAISALPPLNGFVSEVVIYSGLLSGQAPSGSARAALVTMAAVLAFVGGVSALSDDPIVRRRVPRVCARRDGPRLRADARLDDGADDGPRRSDAVPRGVSDRGADGRARAGGAVRGSGRTHRRGRPRDHALSSPGGGAGARRPSRPRTDARLAGRASFTRPRDVGLRIHGAERTDAVHGELLLGFVRAALRVAPPRASS